MLLVVPPPLQYMFSKVQTNLIPISWAHKTNCWILSPIFLSLHINIIPSWIYIKMSTSRTTYKKASTKSIYLIGNSCIITIYSEDITLIQLGRLNNRHYASEDFKQGEERRLWRDTLKHCFEESMFYFHINAEALLPSDAFPYLGRKISYNNRNWLAVYQNLRIYTRRWGMVEMVQENMGATVRSQGEMKKAVA